MPSHWKSGLDAEGFYRYKEVTKEGNSIYTTRDSLKNDSDYWAMLLNIYVY